tara:strand:- start:1640 stop:1780 length:141 start_codon:yes stop_codon:yes gene_type:complete
MGFPDLRDPLVKNDVCGSVLPSMTADVLKAELKIGSFGQRKNFIEV